MTLLITQQTEVLTFHHAEEILEVLPLNEKFTNSASLTLNTLLFSATQSGIHRVESRIQGCPDSLTWGNFNKEIKNKEKQI